MDITKDEWSGLFSELSERVSIQGRRRILFMAIGALYDISFQNFGPNGEHRPTEWEQYRPLYAFLKKGGDRTPTLIDSGLMQNSFTVEIGSDSATLTNTREFASEHQLGNPSKKLPARPFFPIDAQGNLTPYAIEQLNQILDSHFEVSV